MSVLWLLHHSSKLRPVCIICSRLLCQEFGQTRNLCIILFLIKNPCEPICWLLFQKLYFCFARPETLLLGNVMGNKLSLNKLHWIISIPFVVESQFMLLTLEKDLLKDLDFFLMENCNCDVKWKLSPSSCPYISSTKTVFLSVHFEYVRLFCGKEKKILHCPVLSNIILMCDELDIHSICQNHMYC